MMPLWTCALHTSPGGIRVFIFSLRTNIWTLSLIEFSCSTWKVSAESDHAQNVFVDMYNIPFSLSYGIFTCRINLSPLLARGMNEETIPSPPKGKTSGNTCKWHPAEAGLDKLRVIKWPNSHEVKPANFPRGGNSTSPPSSIPSHPIYPKSEGKGFTLLSFLDPWYLHL